MADEPVVFSEGDADRIAKVVLQVEGRPNGIPSGRAMPPVLHDPSRFLKITSLTTVGGLYPARIWTYDYAGAGWADGGFDCWFVAAPGGNAPVVGPGYFCKRVGVANDGALIYSEDLPAPFDLLADTYDPGTGDTDIAVHNVGQVTVDQGSGLELTSPAAGIVRLAAQPCSHAHAGVVDVRAFTDPSQALGAGHKTVDKLTVGFDGTGATLGASGFGWSGTERVSVGVVVVGDPTTSGVASVNFSDDDTAGTPNWLRLVADPAADKFTVDGAAGDVVIDFAGGKFTIPGGAKYCVGADQGQSVTDPVGNVFVGGILKTVGTGSGTTITIGCGLQLVGGTYSVKASDLAGAGLVPGSGCSLDVNPGAGVSIVSDAVTANVGPGLTVNGSNQIVPQTGNGLTVDGSGNIAINPATGSGVGFDGTGHLVLNLLVGGGGGVPGGLQLVSGVLQVLTGCGVQLNATTGAVEFNPADAAGPGLALLGGGTCALQVADGDGVAFDGVGKLTLFVGDGLLLDAVDHKAKVKAGTGLAFAAGAVVVNYGCGVHDDGTGKLAVNNADLASDGLEAAITGCGVKVRTGGGLLIDGADGNAVAVDVGCGVAIDAIDGSLYVLAGDLAGGGLTPDPGAGDCKLKVDVDTGLAIDGTTGKLKVDTTQSDGPTFDVITDVAWTMGADGLIHVDVTKTTKRIKVTPAGLFVDIVTEGTPVVVTNCVQVEGGSVTAS